MIAKAITVFCWQLFKILNRGCRAELDELKQKVESVMAIPTPMSPPGYLECKTQDMEDEQVRDSGQSKCGVQVILSLHRKP